MAEGQTTSSGLTTGAMVCGIVGGVFGLIGAALTFAVSGLGAALDDPDATGILVQALVALALGAAGIVGGAIAKAKPRASAGAQLIAAVGGVIAVSWMWLLAGPLLLVGGMLAWQADDSVR